MQRTKIETFDYVFNPITGCYGPGGTPEYPNRCPYCYAHSFAHRFGKSEAERAFVPVFHPERLDELGKVKKPARVFVCSMADLFGKWVPDQWRYRVLNTIASNRKHTFFLLTKEPEHLPQYFKPPNTWVGASITNQHDASVRIPWLVQGSFPPRYISVEPLLGPVDLSLWVQHLSWVILGAWTGVGAEAHAPRPEWIGYIVDDCQRAGVPLWMKKSCAPVWGERLIQEKP